MFYTIDHQVESPIMLIDKRIGYSVEEGSGIDGSLFQKELLTLDGLGKKSIQCWLNTPGGNVIEGYMICSSILKSKTPVDTYNIGMVASMGFPIFMAGRKRVMMDYAIAMIHNPYYPDGSEPDDFTQAITESMVKMIASRSTISETKVRKMMSEETWLTAEECLKYGFATEIESSSSTNKKWMPAEANNVMAVWEQAKKIAANALLPKSDDKPITNSLNTPKMNLRKITAKLRLNEEASEDSILESIVNMETRAENAEAQVITLKDDNKAKVKELTDKHVAAIADVNNSLQAAKAETVAVQTALDAKVNELSILKAKADGLQKEKDDAIAAEKKTKATTMVAAHVKTGRVKDDKEIIDMWVDKAVADFDTTQKMIEAIPLNVKAAKEAVVEQVDVNKVLGETSATSLAMKARMKRTGTASPTAL